MVTPDGVVPSQMVGVSASVNLPVHHKVQSSLLAPTHEGGPRKRAVKRLWWCGNYLPHISVACLATIYEKPNDDKSQ